MNGKKDRRKGKHIKKMLIAIDDSEGSLKAINYVGDNLPD
jgi:hypothetical protein